MRQRIGAGMGETMRASAWVFAARLLATALAFVAATVVARWYGMDATGFLGLINSATILFGTVTAFGLGTYLIRELGKSDAAEDNFAKRQLFRRAIVVVLMMVAVCLAPTVFLLIQRFPDFASRDLPLATSLVAGALFGQALIKLTVSASRALLPARTYALFLLLPAAINLLIVFAWARVVEASPLVPVAALAAGGLAAGSVALAVSLWTLWRRAGPSTTEQADTPPETHSLFAIGLLRAGFPFFVGHGAAVALVHLNILIAGFFLTVGELGVYFMAHKVSLLAAFSLTSIQLVVQPRFARLRKNGDPERLRRYGRQVSALIVWTTAPIILFFLLARDWIFVTAFGPEFKQGTTLLIILLFGQSVAALTGATNPYLSMTGGQKHLARIIGGSALLSCVLTAVLTPIFGIFGPPIALSAGVAVWNLAALMTIRIRDGFWLCWVPQFTPIAGIKTK